MWSEIVQLSTRSEDVKTKKKQACVLKAIGAISNIANTHININKNED